MNYDVQQLARHIDREHRRIDQNFKSIQNALKQHGSIIDNHSVFVAQQQAKAIFEAEKSILSYMLEKSQLYNQGIMFGGYAGFFAFWAFMNGKASEFIEALSGFFMATSLAVFIAYVVWSNLTINNILANRGKILLENRNDPLKFMQTKEAFDSNLADWQIRQAEFLSIALAMTICPAILAVMILLYSFLRYLSAL